MNLKDFGIVWVGQDYFSSDGTLYKIESSLMDLILMPWQLLGPFGSGDFGLTALSNQLGERGKHFAFSCPKVTVVLHHAYKMSEFFDICGWLNHN